MDVVAYKGDTNSPDFVEVDNVMPGDPVVVAGLADAAKDVTWVIFPVGGAVPLGQSKFHLSCSDPDMNGEEDCGKAEGNGKGNEAGLVNSWSLEGMLGATSRLDCSALLDDRAPTIGSMVVEARRYGATIRWTTDERATTGIDYGMAEVPYTDSSRSCLDTEHVVLLENLDSATNYHFELGAEDLRRQRVQHG